MMDNGVEVQARAKLNLYLHIVGRRADGFHLLESLVAFTADGDRIGARPGPALELSVNGPFSPQLELTRAEDNLVLRAGQALTGWAVVHGHPISGAGLTLDKRLPVASGIGGGSADAAAALLALSELWSLPITGADLAVLGEQLGADVPVCVIGRPALMAGIGSDVSPVAALPPVPTVLVNPGLPLATPAVYRIFREQEAIAPTPRPRPLGPWSDLRALVADLQPTANDLQAAAISLCPAVGEVLGALRGAGALFARMSGSGATCFGFFPTTHEARTAATNIAEAHPAWWTLATRLDDQETAP